MNKILSISALLLLFILSVIIYGSSLSCNYHMKITTPMGKWDGICQLGQSSWIETDADSKWHVMAWSFAIGNQLFFINTQRDLTYKRTNIPTPLDDFNYQTGGDMILSYGLYYLPENKIALFYSFPTEGIFIGELTGKLSLFSSQPNSGLIDLDTLIVDNPIIN
ncbi:hypothetical protein MK852_19305 [Shewanella benthica]|nr:hypothetical protein [Shewanella benthica]